MQRRFAAAVGHVGHIAIIASACSRFHDKSPEYPWTYAPGAWCLDGHEMHG